MSRRALALAVVLATYACGGAVLERSAPQRPAWAGGRPAARDSLYFVGTCTDLPSYQEALRCARGAALTDVAAWVGARFSAYVFTRQTEETRSSGTSAYFDSDLFLAELRRSDTYYEVRRADWGRSYYVSVLIAYPRAQAEAEKSRIEEATVRSERLVRNAPQLVGALADAGRWGDAMNGLIRTVGAAVVPHDLQRSEHEERLAGLADELIAPLRLSAQVVEPERGAGARVEAQTTYRGAPAAGVPLRCLLGAEAVLVETDEEGQAACELTVVAPAAAVRIIVRPAINRYLTALPDGAAGLAAALGRLLDRAVKLETGAPLDLDVVLAGGEGCGRALARLEASLEAAGARLSEPGKGIPRLDVTCRAAAEAGVGDVFTATAAGEVTLKSASGRVSERLGPVRGLGGSAEAAREEALDRLGQVLSEAALTMLRDLNAGKKK